MIRFLIRNLLFLTYLLFFTLSAYAGEWPVVCLDPGHGGSSTGAKSSDGLLEKDFTLQMANDLSKLLIRKAPVNTLLTRSVDGDVSLQARRDFASQNQCSVFVSLHANASPQKNQRGTEIYYSKDQEIESRKLARKVYDQLNLSLKREYPDSRGRGVKAGDFFVLRSVTIPSVLVEFSFLDNPIEGQRMKGSHYRKRLLEGVAAGLIDYLHHFYDSP